MIRKPLKTCRFDPYLIFILCLLPRLYVSFRAFPVWAPSDEVSAMSAAAFAAGFNWRDVVSHAGYYGFGFLFLFAPLFHIIQSPVWIYRIILIVLGAVEAFSAVMCYMTLTLLAPALDRIQKNLICSICGLINILSTVNISNRSEETLAFVVWLTVYLLAKTVLCSETRKKIKYEMTMLAVLSYSLTLHTRAIMLFLAVIAVSVLYWLIWKRLPLHIWAYVGMTAGYLLVSRVVKIYQSRIWSGATRNSSMAGVSSGFLSLIGRDGINRRTIGSFLRITIGQMYTACIMTGGLYVLVIIAFLFGCFPIRKIRENKRSKGLFIAGSFALLCALVTSFGQGLTWLPGVYMGNEYSLKAFMYTRYYGVYVSPVVMCGLVALHKMKSLRKMIILATSFCIIALTIVWRSHIYPLLIGTSWHSASDWQFMFLGQMRQGVVTTSANWLSATMVLLSVVVLMCVLLSTGREKMFLLFVVGLLIVERCYTFDLEMLPDEKRAYSMGDSGYALICQLNEKQPIDDIYVYDTVEKEDNQMFYIYQFLNYRQHVIPELPETDDWRFVFSNGDIADTTISQCWRVQLDNNEQLYIRRYDDMADIKALGYVPRLLGDQPRGI